MKDKPNMLQTSRRLSVRVLVLVALFVATEVSAQVPVTDLGSLGSFVMSSAATDINNRGNVAGLSFTDSFDLHAFFWTLDKGMIDLGVLEENVDTEAWAINDHGQVVGQSARAFLWSEDDGMIDLGTLGGEQSVATDINNLGQVVGRSQAVGSRSNDHAFFWSPETGMIELGKSGWEGPILGRPAPVINELGQVAVSGVSNFLWSKDGGFVEIPDGLLVADLNDRGQVVGQLKSLPFLWSEAAGLRDLSTPEIDFGCPIAINNLGQVTGYVKPTGSIYYRPFFWSEDDGLIILDSLLGLSSFALDINDLGMVAGISYGANGTTAFRWTREDGMIDLGTLGGQFAHDPIRTNDLGQVVGQSAPAESDGTHATLWGETRIADLWLEQSARRVSARTVRLTLTVHSAPGCRAAEPEVCGFGATVDAENVVLIDHLPLDPTRIEVVSMPSACGYDQGTHTVTCQTALLPRDSSVSVVIEARYTGAGGDLADAVNSATVSSDTFDSNPDNNTVTLSRSGS